MENIKARIEDLITLEKERTKANDMYESEKHRIEENIARYVKYEYLKDYVFINVYVRINMPRDYCGHKYNDTVEIIICILSRSGKEIPNNKILKTKITKLTNKATECNYCPYIDSDIGSYFIVKNFSFNKKDWIDKENLTFVRDFLIKRN
jgi:hypothetical protein